MTLPWPPLSTTMPASLRPTTFRAPIPAVGPPTMLKLPPEISMPKRLLPSAAPGAGAGSVRLPTLLLPSAATPTKLFAMTFPDAEASRVPTTWMPSMALPETTLRSANAVVPILLFEALRMRMPSLPLGIRTVPAGLTPTKLPTMKLRLLWTRMPTPPLRFESAWKRLIARPSMMLPAKVVFPMMAPPLPAPRVKPLTPAPAPVPFNSMSRTALSALASVLTEATPCV